MRIELLIGDITDTTAGAIVNAAKPELTGGGGVDGAVHRAAGPALLAACMALPVLEGDDVRCPVGQAKITEAFDLPNTFVIHTAGPKYKDLGAEDSEKVLAACYHNCLLQAASYTAKSIAFPAIGTGIYGYPLEDATIVAIKTVADLGRKRPNDFADMVVKFVCYDEANWLVYDRVLTAYKEGWYKSVDI
jgi:O-acetyl-ADP-ribose deacetylase (regulator of RNase III)